MQTIGEGPRGQSTKVYRARLIDIKGTEHELLMYSMDSITANVEKVDMGLAMKLFNDKVVEEQIRRPEGQVDMLIGLHAAALFPTVKNPEQDVIGNLRLLSTRFGTGWLVDGQHPEVAPSGIRMSSEALQSRINAVEKMGEQQPRRSGADNSDKIGSVGVAASRKKDGREPQLTQDKLQRRSGMLEDPALGSTSPDETLGQPDTKEYAVNSKSAKEARVSTAYDEGQQNIFGQEEWKKPRTKSSSKDDEATAGCNARVRTTETNLRSPSDTTTTTKQGLINDCTRGK